MKNIRKYLIIILSIILLFLFQNETLAISNNTNQLVSGILQATNNILKGENTTMTIILGQDEDNPKRITVTGEDTTYNFVSLKWISGYVEVEDVGVFDTASAHTIEIIEGKTISASFTIDTYGQYSVLARNSNGDGFIARILTISKDAPTMTVTKNESNPLKVTVVAQDGEENIEHIKIAKKETKDEVIDFKVQGTEIPITPAQTVTIEHTFNEDGIYAIYAEDTSGNNFTKTVYIYEKFPITANITARDKVLTIKATSTLSNIIEVKVVDNQTNKETILSITPSRSISTVYTANTYGNYTVYVKDELGFETESRINITEDTVTPTITYSPSERTNLPVTATITFDKEGVTITNNNAQNTYTFTKNDSFTFEYKTSAGTELSKKATVSWIEPVDIEKNYRILEISRNIYIKKIPVLTKASEFLTNINVIDANYKIYDAFDNSIAQATALGTEMKLKSDTTTYTLVVVGDINADSRLSSTDLSQLKLHIVNATELTGANYQAADMNLNDEITITDLSQMKARLVEE